VIPVPALVEAALFDAVQAQLAENRQRARIPLTGSRYLLQGLVVCARCGYAYYGRTHDAPMTHAMPTIAVVGRMLIAGAAPDCV
jgi:hypothetical protein